MRSVSGRPARPGNAIVTAGHPVPRVPSAPGAPSRSGAPKPLTRNCVRDPVQGYAPLVTGDHRELSRLIGTERPRLILLDLMLPDADGIKLMQNVPELADQPVIFISAYGCDETSAQDLESGAMDYILKPISPTELAIHYDERRVTVAGSRVELSSTEYELLRVLSINAGRVSTCNDLLRQVWDGRYHLGTDPVRAFIKKLRRKLGDDPRDPVCIFNQRGVGYWMPRPEKP